MIFPFSASLYHLDSKLFTNQYDLKFVLITIFCFKMYLLYYAVGGSGKDGANSAGCIDVDPTHVTTMSSGSLSGSNATNIVGLRPSSDEIGKNLFNSPQLQHCNSNDAEKSSSMVHKGDPENLTSK